MKTILLHGLGQTAQDWNEVVRCMAGSAVECPELFSASGNECSLCSDFGEFGAAICRRGGTFAPLRSISWGNPSARLYDSTRKKVGALVCIGAQYKVPRLLLDVQTLLFRCMPHQIFADRGMARRGYLEAFSFYAQFGSHSAAQGDSLSCNNYVWGKGLGESKSCGKIASSLAQAKLQILSGVGHEVNREAPQVLADMLLSAE